MKRILLFIAILTLSQGLLSDDNLRYINYSDIDKDDFGRTLIDTLELHIKSGDGFQKFMDIMRDLEDQVEQELKDDTDNNTEFQQQCDSDLQNAIQELNDISLSITEKQSKLDELNNELQRKQQIQHAKQSWLKQLQDQLDQKTTQRNQEKEKFNQEIDENSYVLYVIAEVKKKFLNEDGISLIELNSNNSNALADILEDDLENAVDESRNFRQNKEYQKLFSILAQITARVRNKGDSEALGKLKDISEQLLLNVSDNMSLIRNQEDKYQSIYEKEKGVLDKNIGQVNNDLGMIESDLANVQNKIDMSGNDLDDYKQRKTNKEQTKKDRYEECQLAAYNYKQGRDDNEKKRQLISQVIGLYSANQREFKEYIHQRQ